MTTKTKPSGRGQAAPHAVATLDLYSSNASAPVGFRPWRGSGDRRPSPLELVLEVFAELDVVAPAEFVTAVDRFFELRGAKAPLDDRSARRRATELDVSAGKITVATATKRLGEIQSDDEITHSVRTHSRSVRRASELAYRDAVVAMQAAADTIIAEQLRPIVEAALDAPTPAASERWATAHKAADLLRREGFAPSCSASLNEHRFARPDLLHCWQLDHAEHVRTTVIDVKPGGVYRVIRRARGVPPTTLELATEHRADWGSGLYIASEVLANLQAVAVEHDRLLGVASERATLMKRGGPVAVQHGVRSG